MFSLKFAGDFALFVMPEDRIEAKLAGYIDGQLPPEEMVEVERYLVAHPRERRVVEQMLMARQWMASMPRLRAPADMLEAIDPTLERAGLLEEAPAISRWQLLVSPQSLALAATLALVATLVMAMLWLMPQRDDSIAVIPPPILDNGQDQPDGPAPDELIGPVAKDDPTGPDVDETMPGDEDGVPENDIVRPPDVSDTDAVAKAPDDAGGEVAVLPENIAEAVLLNASVQSLPQASGAVSQFLTAADLPIDAQRLSVSSLPETLRQRLKVPDDETVLVYVVDRLSLEQVGALTTELSGAGRAAAHTPASFIAQHKPEGDIEEPVVPPQAGEVQRIYNEDRLTVLIQREDEPPAEPQAGIPVIGKRHLVEVEVTSDGYADFGKIGLGRIDVLGRQVSEVAEEVAASLRTSFQIEAQVQASIAVRGARREAIQLTYLDREPLKPSDLVQIELPDGSWMHLVVNQQGMLDAGELGKIEAAGTSAAQVQEQLRQLALARAAEVEVAPITTDQSPRQMRVVNLSARRAQGVDSWAQTNVACLVVLSAAPQEPDPPTTTLTRPATQPVSDPATPERPRHRLPRAQSDGQ